MRAVVVGAGISGAFAADTLRTRLGPELQLHVLERETRTGGRAFRRQVLGAEVETGASLIHSSNRLIAGTAAALGLNVMDADTGGSLGLWDGSRLLFRTGGHPRRDTVRLLARYRLPLFRATRQVARLVRQLHDVYPRLERGDSWETPAQLLREIGLYDLTQQPADNHLGPGRFVTEFVDGVSRNNYAQDSHDLNAFVELVSLAGAGLGGGALQRVAEGNDVIAAGLVGRSGAELLTAATVDRIERVASGWRISGDGFAPLEAEIVVLAAPLEVSEVYLVDVPAPPLRSFVSVHVTFVDGAVRPTSLGGAVPPPAFTLTTAAAGSLLSIEHVADTPTGLLYKVFSTDPLSDDTIERLFTVTDVMRMTWLAYPRLPPTATWPAFSLAPGLYYTGAMEYAVSTMETQAIAGVATANLASSASGEGHR